MWQGRTRRFAAVVCGSLGILLILLAVLLGYARRSLFDERAFASRVAASHEDPRVARLAAEEIADGVIAAKPDLVGLRPIIVAASKTVVASAPFRAAVKRSARTLHHAITTGTATDIVLTVKDVGAIVESAVANQPKIAGKLPAGLTAAIGKLDTLPGGEGAVWLVRFANRMRTATIAFLLLGMALCIASAWLANDRRRAIVRLGVSLMIVAILLAIVARFGGDFLTLFARHQERAPALAGLAGAFLGGLMAWAMTVGFVGLVLAASSASLLERVPLAASAERVRAWLFGPQPLMRIRLLRGLLGTVIGALLLFWTLPALTVLGWLVGLVIAFAGIREAFAAGLHLLPQFEPKTREERTARRGTVSGAAIAVVAVVVVAIVGTTVWALLRSRDEPAAPTEVTAYNGLPELGDRHLDEVVFATTHNAMGSPDTEGWMFPNQSANIERQLEDGIRGFLIDATYGMKAGNYIKTELDSTAGGMAKYEKAVGAEGMDAALKIRDRLAGLETGKRDVYMCHGFCELGALRLVPVLADVRDFLVANPGEVLIIVIQDEGVPTQELARCFTESGLIDFVYRGPVGPPWPTLREMVDGEQRVLVMTENRAEGVDWIHPAFQVLQETPYTFHHRSQFSNQPNRGGTSGSLLLMNHWIESTPMPKPSNADTVNARDFLLARIKALRKERGKLPNMVAVDFYREGDLVAVVQELNARPLELANAADRPRGRSRR